MHGVWSVEECNWVKDQTQENESGGVKVKQNKQKNKTRKDGIGKNMNSRNAENKEDAMDGRIEVKKEERMKGYKWRWRQERENERKWERNRKSKKGAKAQKVKTTQT